MSIEMYLAFVAASAALIAVPGANVALIVANAVAHGRRYGLLTVAGTSAAMVPQLALAVLGMAGALGVASHVFGWVRWAGVAYLAWLGIQAWRAPAMDLTRVAPEPRSPRGIVARGFLVSLTNPKGFVRSRARGLGWPGGRPRVGSRPADGRLGTRGWSASAAVRPPSRSGRSAPPGATAGFAAAPAAGSTTSGAAAR